MSNPKNPEANPGAEAHVADDELTEEDLEQVSGGVKPTTGIKVAQDTTVNNKAKTADKAYQQMDAYIKQ